MISELERSVKQKGIPVMINWASVRKKKTSSPACPLGKQLLHFACLGQVLTHLSYDLV